jgi:hypothetical protein
MECAASLDVVKLRNVILIVNRGVDLHVAVAVKVHDHDQNHDHDHVEDHVTQLGTAGQPLAEHGLVCAQC